MSITDKGNLFWLYRSKPLVRPGALILGCFKALFVKYYLPAYVLLCGIFIVMLDWVILPDLLFILVVSTLVSYIYLWFSGMLFPFSKEKSSMDSGRNMLRVIVPVSYTHLGKRGENDLLLFTSDGCGGENSQSGDLD